MGIDSVSGVYVEGVLGGKLVSQDNPIPVNVIGGSVGGGNSGGSDISLPTDANGNVLMNLNAIGTSDSLGVNIESVKSGVSLPVDIGTPSIIIKSSETSLPVSGSVGITGTPTVNVGNTTAIKTSISNTPNVNLSSVSSGVTIPVDWSGMPSFKLAGVDSSLTSIPTKGGILRANVLVAQALTLSQSSSGFTDFYNQAYTGSFSGSDFYVRLVGSYSGSSGSGFFYFQYPNGSKALFPCGTTIDILGTMSGTPAASAGFNQAGSWNAASTEVFLCYWCYTVS